jgi:nucleoside-diphosphate-sugar epimerase
MCYSLARSPACKADQFRWVEGGRELTSTCHVENICEGLVAAAQRGTPGRVYHITDGESRSYREFLEPLLQAKGVDICNIGDTSRTVAKRFEAAAVYPCC